MYYLILMCRPSPQALYALETGPVDDLALMRSGRVSIALSYSRSMSCFGTNLWCPCLGRRSRLLAKRVREDIDGFQRCPGYIDRERHGRSGREVGV